MTAGLSVVSLGAGVVVVVVVFKTSSCGALAPFTIGDGVDESVQICPKQLPNAFLSLDFMEPASAHWAATKQQQRATIISAAGFFCMALI